MTDPKLPARRSRGATKPASAKPAAPPSASAAKPAAAKPVSAAKPATPKPVSAAKPAGPKRVPAAKPATAAKPRSASRATTSPAVAPPIRATPGPRTFWISGATGFVGKAVVRALRSRGDQVIAPVRDPRRAQDLIDMGVTVIEDDLSDVAGIADQLRDVDAAIHAAGSYRVGITREERGAMWDANIGTTTRVLDAAEIAHTPRVVYVSTVNVFGNTHGQAVDELYRRKLRDGFLSWY